MKTIVIVLSVLCLIGYAQAGPPGSPPSSKHNVVPIVDGMTLTEEQMLGGTLANIGATGTVQINVPDIDKELFFFVDARVAQIIEIGFAEAGANPYLQGTQVGADNEIDVAASAKLRVERVWDGTAWAWKAYFVRGVSVDGGADD